MDYFKIVAEGRLEKLEVVAQRIVNEFECKVVSSPSPGMIMLKHVDPIDKTQFYLGEAFVTECEVEVSGKLGYGCVLGDEPERALYGAIIDSTLGNGCDIPVEAKELLESEMQHIRNEQVKEKNRVLSTKVNFDVKKG